MTCPLCGHQANENELKYACNSCPLAIGCKALCCPKCGYEMMRDSLLASWMKRIQLKDSESASECLKSKLS